LSLYFILLNSVNEINHFGPLEESSAKSLHFIHATPKGRHCIYCNFEEWFKPSEDWAHKLQLCVEPELEAGFPSDRCLLAAGCWRLTAPSLA